MVPRVQHPARSRTCLTFSFQILVKCLRWKHNFSAPTQSGRGGGGSTTRACVGIVGIPSNPTIRASSPSASPFLPSSLYSLCSCSVLAAFGTSRRNNLRATADGFIERPALENVPTCSHRREKFPRGGVSSRFACKSPRPLRFDSPPRLIGSRFRAPARTTARRARLIRGGRGGGERSSGERERERELYFGDRRAGIASPHPHPFPFSPSFREDEDAARGRRLYVHAYNVFLPMQKTGTRRSEPRLARDAWTFSTELVSLLRRDVKTDRRASRNFISPRRDEFTARSRRLLRDLAHRRSSGANKTPPIPRASGASGSFRLSPFPPLALSSDCPWLCIGGFASSITNSPPPPLAWNESLIWRAPRRGKFIFDRLAGMCLRRPDLIKTLATIEAKATKDGRGKERGEREREGKA